MAQAPIQKSRIIVWFRDDLRLHDNPTVHAAATKVKSKQAAEVVPLYCFDPRHFGTTPHGSKKTGDYRAKFLLESVQDLKQNLKSIGSDLLIHMGRPEDALTELANVEQKTTILLQTQITSEELSVEAKVKRALKGQAQCECVWGHTLYHPEDVPYKLDMSDLPDTFTPARHKIEQHAQVRAALPTPQQGELPLPDGLPKAMLECNPQAVEDLNAVVPKGSQQLSSQELNEHAVHRFKGGETEALARLKYYLWDTDLLTNYFQTRNGMLGGDYSTKFSPWLAHGNLSARTIYHEIKKYESARKANKSTYWVIFELLWRDYFRFFTQKHGNKLFAEYGITGKKLRWNEDPQAFQRWKDGQTGLPLVDANMRELKQTGFMSNRGRQNVASYLVLDMGVDWRKGADWFETVLQDYDVCSNWGNWVAAAGLTGGRINHFNITKQSKDYDLEGEYAKTWIPELKNVSSKRIHEPWLMSQSEQQQFGVSIGQDYPAPIPSSQLVRPHGSPEGGRNQGGGTGRGRGGKRGHGRGGRQNDRHRTQPRGEYERFG
ncbi:hypothetical protein WJX77_008773 [Trebouxia sp. C0004]